MEEIIIERGSLDKAGEMAAGRFGKAKAALISDHTVSALYGGRLKRSLEEAGFSVLCHSVPPGEASKSFSQYEGTLRFLARSGLTRSDLVFALGAGWWGSGGLRRGQLPAGRQAGAGPTTLLACVDSAIGGKVAIDLREGKNLVGAFHPAQLVLMDPDCLRSLSEAEYRNGLAEVVKTAAIRDADLFERIPYDVGEEQAIIRRCVEIKMDVVGQDEKDLGDRKLLNFGHTFGHAIEALSGYQMSHGQAIAIGMAMIARPAPGWAFARRGSRRLIGTLRLLGMETENPYDEEAIFHAMMMDKKRAGDSIGLI